LGTGRQEEKDCKNNLADYEEEDTISDLYCIKIS
jgi:hypothetical protein